MKCLTHNRKIINLKKQIKILFNIILLTYNDTEVLCWIANHEH